MSTLQPTFSKILHAISRLILWSSHSKILLSFNWLKSASLLWEGGTVSETVCSAIRNGSVTEILVPLPFSLLMSIVPSIMSTKFLTMDMPRPVPPILSTILPYSCSKGSNIFDRNASLIPIPVSVTRNSASSSVSLRLQPFTDNSTLPPAGVNFTALDNRLIKICLMRILSPYRTSFAISVQQIKSSFFDLAIILIWLSTASITDCSSSGSVCRLIFFSSILLMSNVSLIKFSRYTLELLICSRFSLISPLTSSFSRVNVVKPMIPFIGVRISWLTRWRNSDFALFASWSWRLLDSKSLA